MWRKCKRLFAWTDAAVVLSVLMATSLSQSIKAQSNIWVKETIDGGAWHVSLDFDHTDIPHLAYAWPWGTIKYAYRSGGDWVISTVATGNYPSLALDANDQPRISYYDGADGDLKYAVWTGTAWSIETADSTGDVGAYTSLALDSAGHPHISYADRDSGSLKYATFDGSTWVKEVIDGGMYSHSEHSSIAMDSSDIPQIAYYSSGDLKYASRSSGSWSTETVDSAGTTGAYCSLAFDNEDKPHISYWSLTNGNVQYATRPGVTWQITDVDDGSYSFLALDQGDHPHIVYWDGDAGQTQYGWYNGLQWNTEVVGEAGMSSGENWRFTVSTNSRGRPGVAYWGEGISLTYAGRQVIPPSTVIIQSSGGELTGADGVTLILPNGCITDTVVITYTPQIASMTGDLASTGYAFDLTAVYSNTGQVAQVASGQRYTAIITYTNIGPVIENDKLGLYCWDEGTSQWSQQGITSTVNITDNVVTAQVSHFSLFAVLGETRRVFLPAVLRNY